MRRPASAGAARSCRSFRRRSQVSTASAAQMHANVAACAAVKGSRKTQDGEEELEARREVLEEAQRREREASGRRARTARAARR